MWFQFRLKKTQPKSPLPGRTSRRAAPPLSSKAQPHTEQTRLNNNTGQVKTISREKTKTK